MEQSPHVASSKRTTQGITVIAGLIMAVSLVGNEILGISNTFPMVVPLWCMLMIGGSLYLLAYQEQVPDVSHIIQGATIVDTYTKELPVLPNTLYAITDTLTTDAPINDAPNHRGGNYVVLERIVEELYRENDASSNHTQTVWKELAREPIFADPVRIGAYTFTPTTELLSTMPYQDLAADPVLEEREAVEVDRKYIYSKGPLLFRLGHFGIAPGDKRISYRAVASNQTATLIGVPAGDTFAAFVSPTGLTLHHLFAGTLSDAVNTMQHEFVKARRQTRIVITIVQLIVWYTLFAAIDVGTRLSWGESAFYVNLAVGIICAIASVIIVSVLYDPIKST
jgi:Transmembrane protein 43